MKKNSSQLSLVNNSNSPLLITVEYIHYVEALPPGDMFKIEIYSTPEIDLKSIFKVEFDGANSLTILLNNNIEFFGSYQVFFYVGDKCVYSQKL